MQKYVERTQYLAELGRFRDRTDVVKVISGIRRCGKTTLLMQYAESLKNSGVPGSEMLYINLESWEFDSISDHLALNGYLRKNVPRTGRFYLFMDEVQRVQGWQRSVDSLLVDTEADIYITGSNAFLLSDELSTFLAGRYAEVRMLPLSFREYLDLRGGGRDPEAVFRDYFEWGGFPGADPAMGETALSVLLDDIFDSVVLRDVVFRGEVRDAASLDKLVRFLMLNIGNPISSSSLSKALSLNVRTIDRYLDLLQRAGLFHKVDRYDLRSTIFGPTPKYYVADTGIRNNTVGMASKDRGRVLENMVYLELRRRSYRVMTGKWGSAEVDFVAERNGARSYWQVCLGYYDDDTERRELAPLRAIRDSNPKTVVLLNGTGRSRTQDGITEIGAVDFFLTADSDQGA